MAQAVLDGGTKVDNLYEYLSHQKIGRHMELVKMAEKEKETYHP